jgi:multidrug efflux pump subunit AcrA (membrane-fusion protein)
MDFFAKKLTHRQKMTLWVTMVPVAALGLTMIYPYLLLAGSFLFGVAGADSLVEPPPEEVASSWQTDDVEQQGEFSKNNRLAANGSTEEPSESLRLAGENVSGKIPVRTGRLDAIQPDSMVQKFSGVILPRRSSRLSAKHMARVEKIHVQMGDAVEPGQLLAELDSRELMAEHGMLSAQWLSARARLDELQRGPRPQEIDQAESMVRELEAMYVLRQATVRRTEGLLQSSSVSQQEWDESRASLEATHAQLMSARKTLELLHEGTRKEQIDAQVAIVDSLRSHINKFEVLISDHRIIAPFGGHVQTRFVDEGVIVSPGEPVVEVVESGSLEVHVGLPFGMIEPSTLGRAQIICGDSSTFATPSRMAPTIDQRTRNLEVVFALPSSDVCARIGQAVDVVLDVPADRSGWWVPSSSLVPAARGLWSVLVAQPEDPARERFSNKAESKKDGSSYRVGVCQVELLRSSGDWSQVRGPLNPDDRIILNGSHRITKGQQVYCVIEKGEELEADGRPQPSGDR